jgi:3-keto-5-aminohexanoate cleavage enzyme
MDCIVNFTPTGMLPTREMTPHVPITPAEIAEQVLEAADTGITMVHLHARDPQTGLPTHRAEVFADIISGIRKYDRELVLVVTLSGRNISEFEKRSEPLTLDGELKPDMGSLTLSSVNFNRETSVNTPQMIAALATEMQKRGIAPELEVFDSGMVNYAKYLEKKGLISPPHYFNLIFGNVACAQANLLHLGVLLADLPPDSVWSMGGIGDYQLTVNAVAVAAGGGVRVGLEDNIWYDEKRTVPARNLDMIKRIHALAEIHGRKVMKPSTLREILKLQPGSGRYGRGPVTPVA